MLKKIAISKLTRKRFMNTYQSSPMILNLTKIPLIILPRLSAEGFHESIRIYITKYLHRYKKEYIFLMKIQFK